MNTKSISKWLPCQARCELCGAATFFASIKESAVLINGPRWCSIIAETELKSSEKKYEQKIFCSEVKEDQLVFGAHEALAAALDEVEECDPSFVGLLNSCATSLIGDDLSGVFHGKKLAHPMVSVDSGGLSGQFWEGFNSAMVKLLETLQLKPQAAIPGTVNIIGCCVSYPAWRGDLHELERLLTLLGLRVICVVGADEVSLTELKSLPKASLNLVVYPELGLVTAKKLQEQLGQPYLVAPVPYGLQGSKAWMEKVAAFMNLQPNWQTINDELAHAQEKVDLAIFQLKGNFHYHSFGDVYLELPLGQALSLSKAMATEFPDINEVHVRIEGPDKENMAEAIWKYAYPWDSFSKLSLPEDELTIVLGNTLTRLEVGHHSKIIYEQMLLPYQGLDASTRVYAGIEGWQFLVSELFAKFMDKAYMNPIKI